MSATIDTTCARRAAGLASFVLLAVVGCNSGANLPAGQADAVAQLEAAGAKVDVRDGKVAYVDFYTVRDVAGAVVHVKALPDVQKLNFSGTNLGDNDLAHLAELSELQELGLTGTKVTDVGLVHLGGFKNLTTLTLNECDVADDGMVHLKNLKELKQLHLNGTRVTDAGLKNLDGLQNLEWLLAYGTSVTSKGAAAFQQSHPGTQVVTSEGTSEAGGQSLSE